MARKLAFALTPTNAPQHYSICLIDRDQITTFARAQGEEASATPESIEIFYDEGGGEFAPVAGYDLSTAEGRLILQVINNIYADALSLILACEAPRAA